MNSYLEVIKALAEEKAIQIQSTSNVDDYRDVTSNQALLFISNESYEPRHFRVKPEPSWEEKLWLKVRKNSSIPFSELSEFVEALKNEINNAPQC